MPAEPYRHGRRQSRKPGFWLSGLDNKLKRARIIPNRLGSISSERQSEERKEREENPRGEIAIVEGGA
jgi:hypothetical protein